MNPKPVVLTGRVIRLEPLSETHIPGLAKVGLDASIWRYMLYGNVDTQQKIADFVQDLLARQSQGTDLPFAVVHLQDRAVIGSTRYLDIQRHNRGLEIGGTWYGLGYQRTAVNSEAKYLLLTHAFETLNAVRVQFKTDLDNLTSQKALERIGAVREGILRNHIIRPNGTLRSSVYYSILADEWLQVKARLELFLNRTQN